MVLVNIVISVSGIIPDYAQDIRPCGTPAAMPVKPVLSARKGSGCGIKRLTVVVDNSFAVPSINQHNSCYQVTS